jgi:HEAT repeat protein
LVIDARGAGREIDCQTCGARITVPSEPPPVSAPVPAPAPVPAARQSPVTPAAAGGDARQQVGELIERLRSGDAQAGRALVQLGVSVIPALIEGFKENTLEEPDTNRGAAHVSDLLVKCGAVGVQPLIAKLGKSRHAYLTLGRIGSEEAVRALTSELLSCNWRRVEIACKALGLVQTPNALKVLDLLDKARTSTRSGEVYAAAGAAIAAIRSRSGKDPEPKPLTLQEMVEQSKITPLKALVPRPSVS